MIMSELNLSSGVESKIVLRVEYILEREWMMVMATRESVKEWLSVWRMWALWQIVFICGSRGESFMKDFTYELNNHLVLSTLILMVELVPSISSRPSVNYPIVATVPILNLFYLCSMCFGGIVIHFSHQDLWGALLLSFCNVEQSTYIENSADPILLRLEVSTIFFEYRNVIKVATCFCSHDDYKWRSADVCGKWVKMDLNWILLNFGEQ